MRIKRHLSECAAVLLVGLIISSPFATKAADYEQMATAQAEANAKPGPRQAPARSVPVPTADVSPEMQALINSPYWPIFNVNPKDAAAWKEFVAGMVQGVSPFVHGLAEKLGTSVTPTTIAGVNAFIVTPATIPEKNRNRLLVHLHASGYINLPGEAGTEEAILMAAFGGFKVIAIDYRMPPDFPYPAAMDDAMAVWKEVVKTTDPKNIAIEVRPPEVAWHWPWCCVRKMNICRCQRQSHPAAPPPISLEPATALRPTNGSTMF